MKCSLRLYLDSMPPGHTIAAGSPGVAIPGRPLCQQLVRLSLATTHGTLPLAAEADHLHHTARPVGFGRFTGLGPSLCALVVGIYCPSAEAPTVCIHALYVSDDAKQGPHPQ